MKLFNPTTLLLISTLVFLIAFCRVAWSLRSGSNNTGETTSRPSLLLMLLGFLLQCGFLYLRGQEVGRCPLTSFPDVLCFISWSIVLIYLLIGPAYHISLLGLFTSPLVVMMQGAALLTGLPLVEKAGEVDYWTEMHASVALLSYGAFALAFVAGTMFLVQDRLLKSHKLETLFYRLPPIHSLGLVVFRLMGLGLVLLSLGILSALKMQQMPSTAKLAIIVAVWLAYLIPVLLNVTRNLSSKRTAWVAVVAFILPLASLWLLNAN